MTQLRLPRTGGPTPRGWSTTAALLLALGLTPACQSPGDAAGGGAASGPLANPTVWRAPDPAAVAVPTGVAPAALTPYVGEAAERALLTVEQAVADAAARLGAPADAPAARLQVDLAAEPPLPVQRLFAFAKLDLRQGRAADAVQKLEQAARLAPHRPEVQKLLARTWLALGNRAAATAALEAARTVEPDWFTNMLLARLFVDAQRWDDAIVTLAHASPTPENLPAEDDDNALTPDTADGAATLHAYYLATALNQAGYGRAALDRYGAYFRGDRPDRTVGAVASELALVDRRRPAHLIELGDLAHRLGEPAAALEAYRAATDQLGPDLELTAREVYTLVRLARPGDAADRVAEQVERSRNDPRAVALVQYATANGVAPATLVERLEKVYRDDGEPSGPLVLALAAALPGPAAADLLEAHLAANPDDQTVADRLLSVLLNPANAVPQGPTRAVRRAGEAFDTRDDHAPRRLAGLLVAAGQDAEQTLADALASLDPPTRKRPGFRLLEAMLDAHFGHNDRAIALLQPLRLDEPHWPLPAIELARLYVLTERYDDAEALLATLRNDTDPRVGPLRAALLIRRGDRDQALALLDRLVADQPDNPRLVLDRANLLVAMERPEDAERGLLDALNTMPREEAIYAALLNLYEREPNLQDNYRWVVSRLVQQLPRSRLARLTLAENLEATGHPDRAQRVLDDLLREHPDDRAALALLSQLLVRAGRIDDLVDRLDTMPDDFRAGVGLQLANRFDDQGDAARAEQLLEKLVALDPDRPMLNNALGYRWAMEGRRLGEAERLIERALEKEPDSGAYQDSLGWVYYQQGRFEEAERWLRKALANEPYPVIADHLGDALYRLNRPDEAAAQWRATLELLRQPYNYPDPERVGLDERAQQKLDALTTGQPAPVAPIPTEPK